MKTITKIIYSAFAGFSLACSAFAQQAPDAVSIRVITTFDYPGTGVVSTSPQQINDGRDIVGTSFRSSGARRGFVRFSNGKFSGPIAEPNDTANYTTGQGINNSRLICGEYENGSDFTVHGYFLSGHSFSEFDVPGFLDTSVLGVNNVGDFAGVVEDATGFIQAFVSIGGTITTFGVPGATQTAASQLNSSNQTEGYYVDSSEFTHGYWRDTDGTLHFPIDAPGSIFTLLFGNNDSNWMVGRYVTGDGVTHGLFFVPPNKFVTFDYPGSTFTSFNGINAQGYICGRYLDNASGIEHGIIARVSVGAAANEGARK